MCCTRCNRGRGVGSFQTHWHRTRQLFAQTASQAHSCPVRDLPCRGLNASLLLPGPAPGSRVGPSADDHSLLPGKACFGNAARSCQHWLVDHRTPPNCCYLVLGIVVLGLFSHSCVCGMAWLALESDGSVNGRHIVHESLLTPLARDSVPLRSGGAVSMPKAKGIIFSCHLYPLPFPLRLHAAACGPVLGFAPAS